MICYKDMTFCSGDGCSKFNNCPRALTDKVKKDAKKWWSNNNPPISLFTNPKKLECWRK